MTYYADMHALAASYEEHVVRWLNANGVTARHYTTRDDQFDHGDIWTANGNYEVKFDQKLKDTGNLFIETDERVSAESAYVPSGICARSDARWYWIGDYSDWFLFVRQRLRDEIPQRRVFEIAMKTSRGYLLSVSDAREFAVRYGAFGWPDPLSGMVPVDQIRWG